MKQILTTFLLVALLAACNGGGNTLPIYGERYLDANGDTVYYKVEAFSLTNQEGETITNANFEGKVYVADFFFTNCPSICLATTGQKLRIYERFKDNPNVLLISHTVDPERDSVATLKAYAEGIDVEASKWHMVTAEKQYLYEVGARYFIAAGEDPDAPGGFWHGDKFMLVDQQGHIRGAYSGTDKSRVDQLMKDIDRLLEAVPAK